MRNWAPNGGKKLNNPEFLIPFLLCSSTSSTIIFMMSSLSRVVGRKVYKGVDSIFPVAFIFPKDITWLSHSNGYHLAVRKIHIFFLSRYGLVQQLTGTLRGRNYWSGGRTKLHDYILNKRSLTLLEVFFPQITYARKDNSHRRGLRSAYPPPTAPLLGCRPTTYRALELRIAIRTLSLVASGDSKRRLSHSFPPFYVRAT